MSYPDLPDTDPGLTDLARWYAEALAGGEPHRLTIVQAVDPTLPRRCCHLATRHPRSNECTCLVVTTCHDHGERHHGTHD